MSQSIEAPATTETRTPPSPSTGEGNHSPHASAILFNELVVAHFRWFALNGRYGEFGGLPIEIAPSTWPPNSPPADDELREAEESYDDRLDEFTTSEGEIVAAYWSVKVPSAIVMTMRRRGRIGGFLLGEEFALHRATSWLTASDPRVSELLHHCDTLGNKVAQILRRTPKRVAMTWIFSLESYLLEIVEGRSWKTNHAASATQGYDDAKAGKNSARNQSRASEAIDGGSPTASLGSRESADEDLITRGRIEIIEIEKYYDRAAANAARFLYFWGMLAGALFAAAVGVLVAVLLGGATNVIDIDSTSTRFFFSCYAAGALGAIVSVLTRMRSDRFSLDYEVGRTPAFVLGTFRPFLGAVFGLLIYFALQSKLLQLREPDVDTAFFFFTFLAFVAGFSERLTHVVLGSAERTVAETLKQADDATGGTVTATKTTDADGNTVIVERARKGFLDGR